MTAVEETSRVENELLGVGHEPVPVRDGLVEQLREALAPAAEGLPPGGLWVWKSRLQSLQTCEGLFLAREEEDFTMSDPVLVGRVVHLAAQTLSWSPELAPEDVVRAALRSLQHKDEQVASYLADVGPAGAAEIGLAAVPAIERYLDTWPRLPREWRPAWEKPVRARIGRLTLSAKPDLVLGAPRYGLASMAVVDLKSGELRERHSWEADWHALVLAIAHRVPPRISTVVSLASGEWTDPPRVDLERLPEVAASVARDVLALRELLEDGREEVLSPGRHCMWCPLARTCSASEARR